MPLLSLTQILTKSKLKLHLATNKLLRFKNIILLYLFLKKNNPPHNQLGTYKKHNNLKTLKLKSNYTTKYNI